MTTTTTRTPPTTSGLVGYRATTGQIMRYIAMAGGTLTVVQFALAGYGAFGSFQHQKDFGTHETVGTIIGVVTAVVMIAALISRPTTRTVILSIALFILAGPIQPVLASIGKDHAWVGALHALVGIGILALFGLVSARLPKPVAVS